MCLFKGSKLFAIRISFRLMRKWEERGKKRKQKEGEIRSASAVGVA